MSLQIFAEERSGLTCAVEGIGGSNQQRSGDSGEETLGGEHGSW
jgi:hypothetical protein